VFGVLIDPVEAPRHSTKPSDWRRAELKQERGGDQRGDVRVEECEKYATEAGVDRCPLRLFDPATTERQNWRLPPCRMTPPFKQT